MILSVDKFLVILLGIRTGSMSMGMLSVGSIWIELEGIPCSGMRSAMIYIQGSIRHGKFLSYRLPGTRSAKKGKKKKKKGRGIGVHTTRGRGPSVRIRVFPSLQQLLCFHEYSLGFTTVSHDAQEYPYALVSYLLQPWITDIPVGLEQRSDIHGLSAPKIPVNCPVKG